MKTGIKLIAEERKRQVEVEGWDDEHDDEHDEGELAMAAVCYASPDLIYQLSDGSNNYLFIDPWPSNWLRKWDKRKYKNVVYIIPNGELPNNERIRNLVKAGALIAAEIDRLQRLNGGK